MYGEPGRLNAQMMVGSSMSTCLWTLLVLIPMVWPPCFAKHGDRAIVRCLSSYWSVVSIVPTSSASLTT